MVLILFNEIYLTHIVIQCYKLTSFEKSIRWLILFRLVLVAYKFVIDTSSLHPNILPPNSNRMNAALVE